MERMLRKHSKRYSNVFTGTAPANGESDTFSRADFRVVVGEKPGVLIEHSYPNQFVNPALSD